MSTSRDRSPILPGVVGGVIAYLFGYLVTSVWVSGQVRDALGGFNAIIDLLGGDPIPIWKAVGFAFYNAHLVAMTYPGLTGGRASSNLVLDDGLPVALVIVPLLAIFVLGVAAAWYGASDRRAGAILGAAVTVGYLPLALAGVFVFRISRGDAVIGPDPVAAVLLAGLVYPVIIGALGGVLGEALEGS